MDIFSTPLSGLKAQEMRLNASANNTANAQSTTQIIQGQTVNQPYTPLRVVQQSLVSGGTVAQLATAGREPLKIYAPDDPQADEEGLVATPDVRPEDEAVNRILAKNAFSANVRVLQVAKETTDLLLDI